MHVCYVDESGNDQVLSTPDAAPVLAIAGVTFAETRLKPLVWDFLNLKKEFNPGLRSGRLTELIRTEIKGANLRADIRSGTRRRTRRAIGLLDEVMTLLERHSATLVGQIWIKADNEGVPAGFYPDAIAGMAADVQAQLAAAQSRGLMILDARTKTKNVPSVNGITTRRFKTGGDTLSCMLESPVFGHSDAHVALQVADIVASALLFPMACAAFCSDLTGNTHPHPAYEQLRTRYGPRLMALEHRYADAEGGRTGGIRVRDKRNQVPSRHLYEPAPSGAPARSVVPISAGRRDRQRTRAGIPVPVRTEHP